LSRAYARKTILDEAVALFAPNEIILPDLNSPHYLCFEASSKFAFLYSEEGSRFDREFSRWEGVVERALLAGRRSAHQNRTVLAEVASDLATQSPTAREIANRFDDPIVRAAILSFLVLDTQLTFFRA
jgi:hypothetical protein